jgi:glycine/D-amino acid oxidase-like deaminating enzyme
MQVDYLIIGQGISGTWLSYFLQKAGKSFLVIDNNSKNAPSRIAAGIINPVTGRRHVEVWMAEELLPFAWDAYSRLGNELNITAISQKNILDFFPSPQMRLSFQQRVEEKGQYVYPFNSEEPFREHFHFEFGCGEIRPVYTAHLETILPAWRKQLKEKGLLLESTFDSSCLQVTPEKIYYNDISASAIIFCDGSSGAGNPYFGLLPFAPNKGEVLLAAIPDLANDRIYKKGMMLVPMTEPGLWWIGSSYAWEFDNPAPTTTFREKTEALLREWLKIPFTITDHLSGIRPATLERRPFVGVHPLYPNVGLLNGMGTKGCSLAPYFAKQLADQLCYGKSISPEAELKRFSGILQRSKPPL